jgi:hypothetical protein
MVEQDVSPVGFGQRPDSLGAQGELSLSDAPDRIRIVHFGQPIVSDRLGLRLI